MPCITRQIRGLIDSLKRHHEKEGRVEFGGSDFIFETEEWVSRCRKVDTRKTSLGLDRIGPVDIYDSHKYSRESRVIREVPRPIHININAISSLKVLRFSPLFVIINNKLFRNRASSSCSWGQIFLWQLLFRLIQREFDHSWQSLCHILFKKVDGVLIKR